MRPPKLRYYLVGHEAFTVGFMGWAGVKNGVLLRTAASAEFDAILTTDRAMADQHNPAALPLTVVIFRPTTKRLADLINLVPDLELALSKATPKSFVFVP